MGGWGAKKQTKLTIAQKRNEKRKTSILKEVDTHALQLCAHDALSFWLSTTRCRVHGPWTGPDRTGFLELRSGPVRSNTLRCSRAVPVETEKVTEVVPAEEELVAALAPSPCAGAN